MFERKIEKQIAKINNHGFFISLLILIFFITLFFSPVILSDKLFNSDGQFGTYSQEYSFWSNAWALGWPVIADPVSMVSYPVRIVSFNLNLSFNIFVMLAYQIAAIGMFLFLTKYVSNSSAIFGSIAYTLSGWMLIHLAHTSMIHAAAWFPWMMLGIYLLILGEGEGKKRKGFVILALSIALSISAGHSQITVYSLIFVSTYAIYLIIFYKKRAVLPLLILSTLTGIGLAAPTWMPTLELLGHTYRQKISAEDIFAYSYKLIELPALVIPFAYGSYSSGLYSFQYYLSSSDGETLIFIPPILISLLILGLISKLDNKLDKWFWVCLSVLSLLLMLGKDIPIFSLITEKTFLNLFRAPSRHFMEFSFCISMICALTLDALKNKLIRLKKVNIAILLLTTLLLCSIYLLLTITPSLGIKNNFLVWPVLIAIILYFLNIYFIQSIYILNIFEINLFIILILFIQTVIFGYQLPWNIYSSNYIENAHKPWVKEFKDKIGNNFRVLAANGWQSDVFNPDISRSVGLRSLGWYGPMLNKSLAELTGLTSGGWIQREVLKNNQILDIMSVKYVSIPKSEASLLEKFPQRWKLYSTFDKEIVFENLNVLPRFRTSCNIAKLDKDIDLNHILLLNRMEKGQIFLNDDFNSAIFRNSPQHLCDDEIIISQDTSDRLSLTVNVKEGPVILLINDLWYPGWNLKVNGEKKEILRVNNISKGVLLQSGLNSIDLYYYPSYWPLIYLVFFISLGISLIMLLWHPISKFYYSTLKSKGNL